MKTDAHLQGIYYSACTHPPLLCVKHKCCVYVCRLMHSKVVIRTTVKGSNVESHPNNKKCSQKIKLHPRQEGINTDSRKENNFFFRRSYQCGAKSETCENL